jgi:probable F420-dependent oxidoreductase
MHFGLLMFSTDYSIHPAELARAAEERGFESLLLPEHTHIPASRRSPWPGGPDLPKDYWHTNDPFVALGMAAAVTTKLKVGTGICLVVERDPITLAKEVATLDSLSNGRVLFGIGGGWNAEEMENHGTNFKRRWSILREKIEAMKAIWTQDEPEYHGEHVNFDKLWSWPKPAQKPHPPILLGSASERGLQRVVDYCDGWLPIPGRVDVTTGIKNLRARLEASRRDPRSISVTVFGSPADEERVASYRAAGVDRVCFSLPAASRDQVLPLVDRYAELARKLA